MLMKQLKHLLFQWIIKSNIEYNLCHRYILHLIDQVLSISTKNSRGPVYMPNIQNVIWRREKEKRFPVPTNRINGIVLKV